MSGGQNTSTTMTASVAVARDRKAELADTIKEAHRSAEEAITEVVSQAVRAGEALAEAKELIGPGQMFDDWVTKHTGLSPTTVGIYIRLAHYRNEVEGAPDIQTALLSLRGRPSVAGKVFVKPYSKSDRELAHSLWSEGWAVTPIAAEIGCHPETVKTWLGLNNAKERQREWTRRRTEQRKRKRQDEIDRRMRRQGGGIAEAYSRLRKAAQQLDGEARRTDDPSLRAKLNESLSAVYKATDCLVVAMGAK